MKETRLPERSAVPHSASSVGSEELSSVKRALAANYVGYGDMARLLEQRFRERTGRKFAYAVHSGFHALSLALRALDLPRGSPVALPALTCGSVAAAIEGAEYRHAIFDINRIDLTMEVAALPANVSAIVAPHAYGAPLDVDRLTACGLPWIEDCATSPATVINGKPAGSWGTISVFSFSSTKYITAGGGGMILTNSSEIAAKLEDLLTIDSIGRIAAWKRAPFPRIPGRLPDLNAAVGLIQFDKLEEFFLRRRRIAAIYDSALSGSTAISVPPVSSGHSFFRYIVRTGVGADILATRLAAHGIDARSSVNPWLVGLAGSSIAGPLPNVEYWRGHLLSLPIYPLLSDEQAVFVAETLIAGLKEMSRKSS